MKLIKMKNGYVNADMVESFSVLEYRKSYDIVAYSPSYGSECECYILGKCAEEHNAYQRLKALAEWLVDGESGIFDVMHIMHIWESDNDD